MVEDLDEIEWFDQREITHGRKYPTLGLQRRGTATLNKAAMDALGNPEALAVGYIPSSRTVAIKGVARGAKGAISHHKVSNSSTALFSLVAFTERYSIPHDQARQYAGEARGGVLLFPLDQSEPL